MNFEDELVEQRQEIAALSKEIASLRRELKTREDEHFTALIAIFCSLARLDPDFIERYQTFSIEAALALDSLPKNSVQDAAKSMEPSLFELPGAASSTEA